MADIEQTYELTEADVIVLAELQVATGAAIQAVQSGRLAMGKYLGNILIERYSIADGLTLAFQMDLEHKSFTASEVPDAEARPDPAQAAGDHKKKSPARQRG